MPTPKSTPPRRTQADRRAQTRSALLEATARGLSHAGFANLVLEQVATEAGYTRGALYHQFADKDELALAAVNASFRTWREEVGKLAVQEPDPLQALVVLCRAHAVYCRRDVARLMMTLRVEFDGRDHPVGNRVNEIVEAGIVFMAGLIHAARAAGSIPAGPDPTIVARALFGAVEGLIIQLAGQEPYDEMLAERVALGVLGVPEGPAA